MGLQRYNSITEIDCVTFFPRCACPIPIKYLLAVNINWGDLTENDLLKMRITFAGYSLLIKDIDCVLEMFPCCAP